MFMTYKAIDRSGLKFGAEVFLIFVSNNINESPQDPYNEKTLFNHFNKTNNLTISSREPT